MKTKILPVSLFTFCISACSLTSFAQPFSKDLSFGSNGVVKTNLYVETFITGIAMQNDKILATGTVGYLDFVTVGRYLSDGSLDATFGHNGKVTVNFPEDRSSISGAAVLYDNNKIYVAARRDTFINRYHSKHILVLCRFLSNGDLDNTFGKNGIVTSDSFSVEGAYCMAAQADGKIVVCGYNNEKSPTPLTVGRFMPDGSLDKTFSGNGVASIFFENNTQYLYGYAVAVQPDGKIIAAGETTGPSPDYNHRFAVARFNPNGSLDNSFDSDGKTLTDFYPNGFTEEPNMIVVQPDGKILVGGEASSQILASKFAMTRYNANGTPDNSFGTNGKVIDKVTDVSEIIYMNVGDDNKIFVAGTGIGNIKSLKDTGYIILADYNLNGTRNTAYGTNGLVFYSNDSYGAAYIDPRCGVLQQDKKLVLGGSYTLSSTSTELPALYRYKNDGSSVLRSQTVSSAQQSRLPNMFLYPNPAKGILNINGLNLSANNVLTILNAAGTALMKTEVTGVSQYAWNIQNLHPGMYNLQIKSDDKVITLKFLKE